MGLGSGDFSGTSLLATVNSMQIQMAASLHRRKPKEGGGHPEFSFLAVWKLTPINRHCGRFTPRTRIRGGGS